MKALSFVLLGSLFLLQPTMLSINASVIANETSSVPTEEKKIRKPANIHLLKGETSTRSILPIVPGYIEDNQLYICFGTSIADEYLVVKDTESGEIVYSGTFTGNTLVIALTNLGESYTVEIV
ncbi:DUF3244 domain-containing protein [Bacteroides oleiciplenus]|uniref:DUF3244 domain-containing protein n=1 Tax=Bacteroides oleiciplenus TaxID=626931 RepID=A0A3E5B1N6_9BACE|nr:DUF3244 domain-containing protein [Bacteroides oleiciplenus]RGN31508.1 DUF3244 domain-containing protein [Bacteroides oleiciplenus]